MKLWSRGLGKQQLTMDFMRYEISKDGQEIVIAGRITEPVNWDFWIRFDENDVPGLIRVAKNPNVIGLVLSRWSKKLIPFRRRPKAEEEAQEPEETPKAKTAERRVPEPVASASRSDSSAPESE